MKKLLMISILFLSACAPKTKSPVMKGQAEVVYDNEITLVDLTVQDGKIVAIQIDETVDGNSKKDMGNDYNLKAASSIKKEWYEQIAYLEEKLVGSDGQFELDKNGKAKDRDIISGCTIDLTAISEAINIALEEAK